MIEAVHSSFSEVFVVLKIIWTYASKTSVLLQVRACIPTYAHNNPDRRDKIQLALQDIIQRELPTCPIQVKSASRSISL